MEGVRGMDLKRVYFRYDSQRYVHLGSRWLGEMVWSCVNMVWRHWKILKLSKQILAYGRNKNIFDSISEGAWKLPGMETTKLPVPPFLSISCK